MAAGAAFDIVGGKETFAARALERVLGAEADINPAELQIHF